MPAIAAIMATGSIALFWPGIATYDTVTQFRQVLSGQYDDWHPPAMARLWALLHPLAPGAAPMLVAQMLAYWAGAGLIAAALVAVRRPRAGAAALAVAALPLFLGWQAVVVKDAQMAGAMTGAVGVIAWWRLRDRPVPLAAIAVAGVLLAYAALVRANAIFAIAPLIATLAPMRAVGRRLLLTVAITVATLAAAGPLNHIVMKAERSNVERTQPVFDLAAITVDTGLAEAPLAPDAPARLRAARCVTPFFWDPLGARPPCMAAIAPLTVLPPMRAWLLLATAIGRHPAAYAAHRLRHWNMTERWLVPARLIGGAPPASGESNAIGLGNPGPGARSWQAAAAMTETPAGWPATWLALALSLLVVAWRGNEAAARVAIALLVSAVALEASFLLISIAADLRYHLWPMLATALAAVLLTDRLRAMRWRRVALTLAPATMVAATGLAARVVLPPAPASYAAMLDAPS